MHDYINIVIVCVMSVFAFYLAWRAFTAFQTGEFPYRGGICRRKNNPGYFHFMLGVSAGGAVILMVLIFLMALDR